VRIYCRIAGSSCVEFLAVCRGNASGTKSDSTFFRRDIPLQCRLGRACAVFHFLLVAVDRLLLPYTCIIKCFVNDHTLATQSCPSLNASHHSSQISCDIPGPVTKSPFVVEHELGHGSRAPQENYQQRALREKHSK
jgi:hypothetical protein